MMKKTFRSKLSFSLADVCSMGLDYAGISIGKPIIPDSTESFGIFGSSSDNNKFWGNTIKESDIIPNESDYIRQPFRLISATVVGAGSWKATDFSMAGVLKASVSKLDRKTVYKDHEQDSNNWSGHIENPVWQDAFVNGDGTPIPAGINGVVAIDYKVDPKLARGVASGAIYSNSVTVDFGWEPSHEFSSIDEFEAHVGTLGSDGKMVRRVATNINDYYESSMVWLGADPFGKAIDAEGNFKNVDKGRVVAYSADNAECKKYSTAKTMTAMYGMDGKSFLSLSKNSNFVPNKSDMNKFLVAFLAAFTQQIGVSKVEELTDAHLDKIGELSGLLKSPEDTAAIQLSAQAKPLIEKVRAGLGLAEGAALPDTFDNVSFVASDKLAEYAVAEGKVTSLSAEVATLTTKVGELQPLADKGIAYNNEQRKEAERLYKLSVPKEDESMLTLIRTGDMAVVGSLLNSYTQHLGSDKFKGKCAKCGSEEFSFRSSHADGDDDTKEDTSSEVLNFREKYTKNSMNLLS